MSQYKVPQNVEAEDKILGPLTFKQFIYACIGFGWALICFAIFHFLPAVMFILGVPPTILFLLLAFYTRDGQNFEQLLLAMIGFFASPHERLWIKEEVVESFHIEPTKAIVEPTQRDPADVISELEKLATLIDSRGWNQPAPDTTHNAPATATADRLGAAPAAPSSDEPAVDMLDLKNSPLAQNLSQLLADAAADVRHEAVTQMTSRDRVNPTPAAPTAPSALASANISVVTPVGPNDILKLATGNDHLTVSQVAAQAIRLSPGVAVHLQPTNTLVEPTPNAR